MNSTTDTVEGTQSVKKAERSADAIAAFYCQLTKNFVEKEQALTLTIQWMSRPDTQL